MSYTENNTSYPLKVSEYTGIIVSEQGEKQFYVDGNKISYRIYQMLRVDVDTKPKTDNSKTLKINHQIQTKQPYPKLPPKQKIKITISLVNKQKNSTNNTKDFAQNELDSTNCDNKIVIKRFSGGSSKHCIPKTQTKSILVDLSEYPEIDAHLSSSAESIYHRLNIKTKRGHNRKLLLLMCVYYAKIELGQPQTIKDVAKIFKIDRKGISAARTQFSPEKTGYKPPTIYVDPDYFVKKFYTRIGISLEKLDDVLDMTASVMDKNSSLKDNFPAHVALAIIFFYSKINGLNLDQKKLTRECLDNSYATIQPILNMVEKSYNSSDSCSA